MFLKEKLTRKKILLVLLAFIGIFIVFANKEFSFANKDFLGMSAMLISASLSAITTIFFKKELTNYSKYQLIFYQNAAGAIIFLPFLLINKPFPALPQVTVASIYSLIVGLIAFILWFSALKKTNASTVAIISYIEVVSALLLSALILKEAITWNMAVGGTIILGVSYFAKKIEVIPLTE